MQDVVLNAIPQWGIPETKIAVHIAMCCKKCGSRLYDILDDGSIQIKRNKLEVLIEPNAKVEIICPYCGCKTRIN